VSIDVGLLLLLTGTDSKSFRFFVWANVAEEQMPIKLSKVIAWVIEVESQDICMVLVFVPVFNPNLKVA
jgi:hypothetical protein